jgi:Ca-activated chloride channel family protein
MNNFCLRTLLLSAALLTSVSVGFTWAVSEAMPKVIAAEGQKSATSEISQTQTNVAQIVQPSDWAYQALKSLSDRYGCPVDHPDSLPLDNQTPLTRNQYILALQTCLPTILNHPAITPEDLTTLEQLRKDFPEAFVSAEVAPPPPPPPQPSPTPRPVGGATGGRPLQAGPLYESESSSDNYGGLVPSSRSVPGGQMNSQPETSEEYNREGYNPIDENQFLRAINSPLSTFAIDVDGASYTNVRRFINNNQLPPKDAVRIEEFLNYFTYDYPEPEDDRPFSLTTEISQAPWNPQHKLVHIGLQGQRIATENLPPSNLVFLLDVSGSMDSPDKLPLLKSALRLLVNELRETDRVSIVVYAGSAGLVLPPTPGSQKDQILDAIASLNAGGSTAGGEGIKLAYEVARQNFMRAGNNRVILATDGDFNVGISSDAELIRLIEDYRDRDVFLSVLGFGTGNLQDAKMEQLANRGNGNYAYIDNILEAKKVLVNEIGGTLLTIAKDVKIQVEFNPAKVQAYRLIGYENRLLQAEDFNNDKKDAGELGAGHSVTALYEIIPVGVNSSFELPEVDPLRYQQKTEEFSGNNSDELMLIKLRYKQPTGDRSALISQPLVDREIPLKNASNNFKFAAAVAEFGMILRESKYQGSANLDQVVNLARQSQGEDAAGDRAEFIRLVEACKTLLNSPENDK